MVNNIAHEGPCFCGFAGRARHRAGRLRPARRCRRALVPARHARQRSDVLGADRRRRDQGRLADVELPEQPAPAGQQRAHPRAGARGCAGRRRRRRSGRRPRRASTQLAAEQGQARRSASAELAANPGKPGAINAHYLCAELGKRIAPEDVIFGEATRNTPAVPSRSRARCRARWCASAAAGSAPRAAWRSAPSSRGPTAWRSRSSATAASISTSPTRSSRRRSNTSCRSSPSCSTTAAGRR